MDDLVIPGYVVAAHAHGDLSHAGLALIVAMLRSGEARAGADGRTRMHIDGDLEKLQGAPSRRWLMANLAGLVEAGFIEEQRRPPQPGVPGRLGRTWAVPIGCTFREIVAKESQQSPAFSGSLAHARTGAGQVTTTTTPPSAPPPPNLKSALLHVLELEDVDNPEAMIEERPLNSIAYAVRELAAKLKRREPFTKTRAAYLVSLVQDRVHRPPVTSWEFLQHWDDLEDEPKVTPMRGAR